MKHLKKLFTNTKLSLGAAIGGFTGYLMGAPKEELGALVIVPIVICFGTAIVENMIMNRLNKK
jgi:hypothetical protein